MYVMSKLEKKIYFTLTKTCFQDISMIVFIGIPISRENLVEKNEMKKPDVQFGHCIQYRMTYKVIPLIKTENLKSHMRTYVKSIH